MNCLHCSNLDLQSYPKHSKTGFGRCKIDVEEEEKQRKSMPDYPMQFRSWRMEQSCGNGKEAEPSVVEARVKWASKLNKGGE